MHPDEESELASIQSTRLSILVVDDDESMRALLKLHLSNAGYRVTEAEDAVVAGHKLLKFAPDLMIVDIELPYMSGLDFVSTAMADATIPFVPVLFITAHQHLAERAEPLEAELLIKPFTKPQLLEGVARACSKSATQRRQSSDHTKSDRLQV